MRVELHPLAVEALRKLEEELPREGYKDRGSDLVSALVYGATAPQAHGMCMRFHRDAYQHDHGETGS